MKRAVLEPATPSWIPRLYLIERGVAAWQGGGGQSNWRWPMKILKSWQLLPAREAKRRVGWSGRRYCLRTVRNPRSFAVGQRLGLHHQTVQRCVGRALAYGPLTALDDRPRPGKEPTITPEAKAWLVSLACDKAKNHGYPHELWTTRLLARHARENASAGRFEFTFTPIHGSWLNLIDRPPTPQN
jgi:Homeodomain-like domain